MIDYYNLDKHFTISKNKFHCNKLPRKLKKKVKHYCGVHYDTSTINENYWYYLELNPNYKRFLIKKICDNEKKYEKKY